MSLSILPHLSALVNSEKLLTQAARRPHIKNRPRAGLPGAGQNTAGGQRIRSADYVIPYHGIIGKRVLSKNIISARVTKYITYICSINPPKYSELMHIATLYAFCSSFQKSSSKISSVPAAQTGKQKARLLKQTGFGRGGHFRCPFQLLNLTLPLSPFFKSFKCFICNLQLMIFIGIQLINNMNKFMTIKCYGHNYLALGTNFRY